MIQNKKCPFCVSNNLLEVGILYEDDTWIFVDIREGKTNTGGLAITRRHVETPFEINAEEWNKLHSLLPVFKGIVDKKEKPQGYNMGWNVYPTGGQTVDHAHLHIVARYDDEPYAGKGIRYLFKQKDNARGLK
jgi:histidine triad (HIT) family protein